MPLCGCGPVPEAFARGNHWPHLPRADEMDIRLHAERRSPPALLGEWRNLPDGAMVAQGGKAFLVLAGRLFAWSAAGYLANQKLDSGDVHLLTPPSIVAALAAGYRARPHSSLLALTTAAERVGEHLRI
jgi:hypothetical protein